jgi:putative membrane protein
MGLRERANNFIVGIFVGAASWLPGISGGIVAVIFNVYERLIEDLNNLKVKIKEDFWFLLTIGLGIVMGLVLMALFMNYTMERYMMPMMFLFAGLIIGQFPELMRITKRGEPTRPSHFVWAMLGFAVMMFLLLLYVNDIKTEITDAGTVAGMILSFLAGSVFALSKIVPGISASTVMVVLGLWVWMNGILAHFDLLYLLPFGLGFIASVFIFAKFMGHILKEHHFPVYYFVVGLTLGSVLAILGITYWDGLVNDAADLLVGLAAAAAGVAVSFAFGMFRRPEKAEQF